MTAPTEQYIESLRQAQQAAFKAMETWTENAQKAFGAARPSTVTVTPEQVIDQVFDFAEQMLLLQRRFAKQVANAATKAATTSNS